MSYVMCMMCRAMYGFTAATMITTPVYNIESFSNNINAQKSVQYNISKVQKLPSTLSRLAPPPSNQPEWYKSHLQRESHLNRLSKPIKSEVTYTISTKGKTSSDLAEFSRQSNETLNDARGWARLGVKFKQVDSGGDFDLVLSQPEYMTSFSSYCSSDWSCRVGKSVIINDKRWQKTSKAWGEYGGSIRDYRHMAINHEIGHWLGHGHQNCNVSGESAAVMQQQSIDLQGCKFNPWPLESEIWSTTLGVRKI